MQSDESQLWKEAMDSEMNSLEENNTYTVVTLPKDKKAVGSKWTYAIKSDPDGNVIHKARFVAKGYAQVEGLDYTDTYSPTANMTTVRMIMQFAAEYDLIVHQLDVKTAYLNAPIDCDIYMLQPKGYEQPGEYNDQVWRLNKLLYGLKQSGRNWNIVLDGFFQENGFAKSEVDACLYMKKIASTKIFVVVWVDDIVIAASNEELMKETKDLLKMRFKMKDLRKISWLLGIQFHQTNDAITISQSHYLKGVLERFQMIDCKPRYTPCEAKIEESDETENTDDDIKRYRENRRKSGVRTNMQPTRSRMGSNEIITTPRETDEVRLDDREASAKVYKRHIRYQVNIQKIEGRAESNRIQQRGLGIVNR